MPGRYLLDTNIVIALFANEAEVAGHMAEVAEVFVPSIVLGELYFGARKSTNVASNLQRIDDFSLVASVLSADTETAREYGRIKELLKRKGKPIPENDVWIAALAHQYDLILVSRDLHFEGVEDLKLERW